MPSAIDRDEALDALASEFGDQSEVQPEPHHVRWKKGWRPKLNKPTQQAAYESKARYLLFHGERGSSKTIGALHKLVEHCYLNRNALAIIIVGVKRQAEEGGAWHKLTAEVLPIWRDGNRNKEGKLIDEGIGLEFTEPKTNTAKDVFIWVSNKWGGWSRILLLSMPVESFVADRIKGMEPSFVLVDEAQTLETEVYFTAVIQQLGRRPHIDTVQQVVYCANPAGPSHWLYKRFFEIPVDPETGAWNEDYAEFHFPIQENIHNLPPDYWKNVLEACKNDPTEYARMVQGIWVDRPEGDALFALDFREELHMRGDVLKNQGLCPVKGHPLIFSYDLGAAHTSIHLKQIIPTKDKIYKLTVDEFDFVGQYMPYFRLVPKLIQRMKYWEDRMNCKFYFVHVSDDSAFNQYRAKEGSFDCWDIEQLSKDYVNKTFPGDENKELRERYTIRMVAAPKGPHSVEARVRMTRDSLQQDEILISATCPKTREMFMKLEEDPDNRLKPKKSPFLHKFDSFSYGDFYFLVGRGRFHPTTAAVKPQVYAMGSN